MTITITEAQKIRLQSAIQYRLSLYTSAVERLDEKHFSSDVANFREGIQLLQSVLTQLQ